MSKQKTIHVHNMFSPCSAKIRASDKDLPVPNRQFCLIDCQKKIRNTPYKKENPPIYFDNVWKNLSHQLSDSLCTQKTLETSISIKVTSLRF